MPRLESIRRLLSHPLVVLGLGLLLLFDWFSLPNNPVARSALSVRPVPRGPMHGRPLPLDFYRTPSGLRAVLRNTEVPAHWTSAGWVTVFDDIRRRTGLWGLTREFKSVRLLDAGSLTTAEAASLPGVSGRRSRRPTSSTAPSPS